MALDAERTREILHLRVEDELDRQRIDSEPTYDDALRLVAAHRRTPEGRRRAFRRGLARGLTLAALTLTIAGTIFALRPAPPPPPVVAKPKVFPPDPWMPTPVRMVDLPEGFEVRTHGLVQGFRVTGRGRPFRDRTDAINRIADAMRALHPGQYVWQPTGPSDRHRQVGWGDAIVVAGFPGKLRAVRVPSEFWNQPVDARSPRWRELVP